MQHFVQYIFVYPEGYADPDRLAEDPDYVPGKHGRLEDYHIDIAQSAPQVGDTIDFLTTEDKVVTWKLVEVQRYIAQNANATFHSVICTQRGEIPQRRDWSALEPHALTFYLDGDTLVTNPDGSVLFEFGGASFFEKVSRIEGTVLLKPEAGRPIQGFDLVAIAQADQ